MKLRCKKNIWRYIPGKQYEVYIEYKDFTLIKCSGEIYRFDNKIINSGNYYYLYDYFYNVKEERLLKIKKLNEYETEM